ncbi:MAG: hypothetical protein LRY20_00430 [Acholeplasmataceae bacterium]|nr:hypothetical protein [Acholeplasmataceae bacterium]
MERGPAGNTSLALAFSLAQDMKDDEIIVVQETEYTGAGKHMNAQISFASDRGVELIMGNPLDEKPGKNLIFPSSGAMLKHKEVPLDQLRSSYLKRYQETMLFHGDYEYLALELKTNVEHVKKLMEDLNEAKN